VSLKTGEIIAIERAVGLPMQDWSGVIGAMTMIYATVHRKDAAAITWAQLEDLDIDELDGILVDVDEPASGEAATADPLAGGAPGKKGSSGTRRTPRKAAERSRSAARTT
jgi:hypothetical protein